MALRPNRACRNDTLHSSSSGVQSLTDYRMPVEEVDGLRRQEGRRFGRVDLRTPNLRGQCDTKSPCATR